MKDFTKSRAWKRIERQTSVYHTDRFRRELEHLTKMIELNAPESLIVRAAYLLATTGMRGPWRVIYHSLRDILYWRFYFRLRYLKTRIWWLIRYPGRSAEDIRQEHFDKMVAEHNAEVRALGYEEMAYDSEETAE
jgi:hypothetical protein